MSDTELLIHCITNDMMEPIGYLPLGLIFGAVYLIFLNLIRHFKISFAHGFRIIRRHPEKNRRPLSRSAVKKDLIHFLIIVYAGVLLKLAFFSREPGSRNGISLTPFETWGSTEIAHAFFIENILMFIPFGILMPLAHKYFRNAALCIVSGMLCSLTLELMQLATGRGFCQLDDLLTNTFGAGVGYLLFFAVYRIHKKFLCKL